MLNTASQALASSFPTPLALSLRAPLIQKPSKPILTVGISMNELFDLREANEIQRKGGKQAYQNYLRETTHQPLGPTLALSVIKKLLAFNTPGEDPTVRVLLFSHGKAALYTRAMKSLVHYEVIDSEESPCRQGLITKARPDAVQRHVFERQKCDMFLSSNGPKVHDLLRQGLPAGLIEKTYVDESLLKKEPTAPFVAAFDCDRVAAISVVFDRERLQHSENVLYTERKGVMEARRIEYTHRKKPMEPGPVSRFHQKLADLRLVANSHPEKPDVGIHIVTARMAESVPRVWNTMKAFNINLDSLHTTGDDPKGPVLRNLGATIFFDDSLGHVKNARKESPETLSVHVPWREEHLKRLAPKYHNLALRAE